jgi:hypothetical protein
VDNNILVVVSGLTPIISNSDSIDEIIQDFCVMRFEYYIKRKKYIFIWTYLCRIT